MTGGSSKRLALIAAVVVAVVGCAVLFLWARAPDSPPPLSPAYTMTFDNLTFTIQSDGQLTEVADDGGKVTGQMTVNSPLGGTGAFTGTYADGTLTFVGAAEGTYTGTVDSEGKVTGTYVYSAGGYDGQHGNWTATPTEKPPSNDGPPWWLWLAVALLIAVIVLVVVRRLRRGAGEPHS